MLDQLGAQRANPSVLLLYYYHVATRHPLLALAAVLQRRDVLLVPPRVAFTTLFTLDGSVSGSQDRSADLHFERSGRRVILMFDLSPTPGFCDSLGD